MAEKKSFKDYLADGKTAKKGATVVEPVVEETPIAPVIEEVRQPVIIQQDNTALTEALKKQSDATNTLIESVLAANNELAQSTKAMAEQNEASTTKLVEAISSLVDKISLLEEKIAAIENLEIPAPIVNLTLPRKKVVKDVQRDKKGIITHIIESETYEDDENDTNSGE